MSFQAKSLSAEFTKKIKTKFPPTLHEAVELAEEGSEHPSFGQVIHHVHPGTGERHHQVTDHQVHQVVVGGRLHALVSGDDDHDGQVAENRHHHNENVDGYLHCHFPCRNGPVNGK